VVEVVDQGEVAVDMAPLHHTAVAAATERPRTALLEAADIEEATVVVAGAVTHHIEHTVEPLDIAAYSTNFIQTRSCTTYSFMMDRRHGKLPHCCKIRVD